MPLRATRSIGTGDGWDVTDSGLYVLDWAELDDVRPGHVIENPNGSRSGSTCSPAPAGSRAASSRPA